MRKIELYTYCWDDSHEEFDNLEFSEEIETEMDDDNVAAWAIGYTIRELQNWGATILGMDEDNHVRFRFMPEDDALNMYIWVRLNDEWDWDLSRG